MNAIEGSRTGHRKRCPVFPSLQHATRARTGPAGIWQMDRDAICLTDTLLASPYRVEETPQRGGSEARLVRLRRSGGLCS